uniref:Uncharacterized protein n=1 Tax=Anguilla anguilla TaxID=7936 RepID=A0A0E9U548_ANGAN
MVMMGKCVTATRQQGRAQRC